MKYKELNNKNVNPPSAMLKVPTLIWPARHLFGGLA
jgi:hypothetical protein